MGGRVARVANQTGPTKHETRRGIEITRHLMDDPGQGTNGLVEPAGGALSSVRLFQPLEQPDSGTDCPIVTMRLRQNAVAALGERRIQSKWSRNLRWSQPAATRRIVVFVLSVWMAVLGASVSAQETWQSALSRMPLETKVGELNRTNCVTLMLGAFQSNAIVKALVFMPGATDELY